MTFAFKLELGPLTRVRRGESGLGGIGACALSGIVSASWNVSLVSESSSESVTKADSLGREDCRTGALSFLGSCSGGFFGEGTALTFAAFPDKPDADSSLASLPQADTPPTLVVVGMSSAGLFDQTVCRLGLGRLQRFAVLGVSDTKRCSVERLGVERCGLWSCPIRAIWVSQTDCMSFAMENLTYRTLCGQSSFSNTQD